MKILIADDDPITRKLLEGSLSKSGFEVHIAGDGEQAWNILSQKDAPTLAILSWMMPGMTGPEVCRKVRAEIHERYIYILFLTKKDQKDEMITALEQGVDEYVTKPVDLRELHVRLRTGQRILDLQAELVSAREALQTQATHDILTGLWNRNEILSFLSKEIRRAEREETSLAVILADLDRFKNINDIYGHLSGDKVLAETARRMRSSLRPYDHMGRFGGEEFLIIMPGCNLDTARNRAHELLACVNKEAIELESDKVVVTCSMGLVVSEPDRRIDTISLLRAADEALDHAKNKGRNRVESAASNRK